MRTKLNVLTLIPFTVVLFALNWPVQSAELTNIFPILPWNNPPDEDRKSTRLNSSHLVISYAVFCLKKKKKSLFTTPPQNSYYHTPEVNTSQSLSFSTMAKSPRSSLLPSFIRNLLPPLKFTPYLCC